jgi:hypothetical protein
MALDTNLNVDPYYDDFDEAKNFHRILFRPAVPIQARELTQLQTILQNQIERFGDNIFVQGTIIQGCNFNYDSKYSYIKLPDLRVDGQPVNPDQFLGYRVVSSTSNLQAIVINSIQGLESQLPDLNTIYVKYVNSGTGGEATFANGEQLAFFSNTDVSNTTTEVATYATKVAPTKINGIDTNPIGYGYAFSVGEGIIFQKGFFIRVANNLNTVITKYTNSPNNVSVGFSTQEDIITDLNDASLLDNASGYTNVNAPGANRLKLTPTLLVANTDVIPSNNFLSIVDWNNGNVIRARQTTQYNVIDKEMARREYETNGNFVIKPFKLNSEVNPANSVTFNATISSGLAYVDGYRVQLENSSKYEIRKGIDTVDLTGQNISTGYGNYIKVKEVAGYFSIGSSVNLYDDATSAITNETYTSISASGNLIGTATVLSFIYANGTVDTPDAQYYLYLTNIQMNSGKSFASVAGVASTTGVADIILTYNLSLDANVATLIDPNFSKTIFYTGKSYVKTLAPAATINTSFVFRKTDTINVSTLGVSSTVSLTGNQQFYYGTGTLTSLEEQAVIVIPTSSIYVANAVGTVSTTNTSPNVIGTSTTFLTTYQENDYISFGNSTVYTTKQIKSIANNTLLILSSPTVNAATANSHGKIYPKNIPINFADRYSTIDLASPTAMTFTLRDATNAVETLQAAANVSIYYDVKSITTAATQKTINKNRTVCIDTAKFLPFTANVTCNTANAVIATTNTTVSSYVSPGYKIYLSGDNSTSSLLGTVASVNTTAITLTANATANCFTFVPFGGNATCNTASAIITCTNTAVNTYISAGYKIYLASNAEYLGTVLSTNTTTITLDANALDNITDANINFSSAINQITLSANGSVGPNGPWSLGLPDVYRIKNVYKIPAGTAFTNSAVYDATGSFALETNQTDTTYGISKLVRNSGSGNIPMRNGDKLVAVLDVFTIPSSSGPGFFTVDSYPIDDANTANTSAIQTQNIPVYTTSTGKIISLRDHVDFRAYVANTISLAATANVTTASANAVVINPPDNTTFSSTGFITPDQSFGYDITYYVGRIDKIQLSQGGAVNIIEGLPAESPKQPRSPATGITIGNINIPPYPTLVASQITVQTKNQPVVVTSANQNRRYTMKDINGLNQRISKLEYYSSLSLLEQKTKNLSIKNSTTGQDRFKNGIFVDNFESTFGSNLNDPEYFASYDPAETSIIPRFDQFKIDLRYNTNENANTVLHSHTKTNDVATLAYTEISYLNQNTATRVRNCTEGYYNWTGTMFTVPLYDGFIDTRIPPPPPKKPDPPPVEPPPVVIWEPPGPPPGGGDPPDKGTGVFTPIPNPPFPRPQTGNMVWISEIDSAIFLPGDFINGKVVYNSQLGYYTVEDPAIDPLIIFVDPVYGFFGVTGGGSSVVYSEGNTDPVITTVVDSNNTVPPAGPVETSIWISYSYDNDTGEYIGTTHPVEEAAVIDTNISSDNNTFNINDSQQWYDDYNQSSYW